MKKEINEIRSRGQGKKKKNTEKPPTPKAA